MIAIAFAVSALAAFLPGAQAAPREAKVLAVGDSLQELTAPYISRHLPPGVELTVNAVGGYNSYQVFDLFEQSYDPSYSVIVFDGGTNDNPNYPQILAGNLAKVASMVGDRCMVVPTVHGFTVEGVDNTGKNRVVREFAASRPGTQVPDWAAAEAAHPELMQSDDLHPIQGGAELRAELIAQGISACLSGAATQLGGGEGSSARASNQAPLLDEAPPPIKGVGKIASRKQELLNAVGMAVGARAALALAGGVFGRR